MNYTQTAFTGRTGARPITALTRELMHDVPFLSLVLIWLASMFLLFYIRDIGSSLMFFGAFLAGALSRAPGHVE